LPRNVTRISKSAFRLCPLAGKEARNVVVYLMDHSGSMSGNDRDPSGIAGTAFQQAMARQYELDSASFAGYIPFSGFVIGGKTIAPTRLDNGGLALVQSQVDANYSHKDGTNFISPLKLAKAWLEAPEFDGYNKFIVFMADGAPVRNETTWGDSTSIYARELYQLLGASDFPLTHTIYFGVPESQAGVKLMDSLAHLTRDAEGKKGQFRQLNTVEAVRAAMDTLVQASIKSSSPLELTIINKTTRDTVSVDQSRMKQLVDSTWISVMTSDLPVDSGKNSMELVGRYQNAGATAIPFTIYVDSTYNNTNSRIQGTPFTTSCHEIVKLAILNEQAKSVFVFDQSDTVSLVRFRPDDRSYGISLDFKVKAFGSGDTMTVTATLTSTPQGWLYQARLPLDWSETALPDRRLQVASLDSFRVSWTHPDDPQDHIEATQRVLWQLARPETVALHDVDHNGVLDELEICMIHSVDQSTLDSLTMYFSWPATNGLDTVTVVWDPGAPEISWNSDSSCAYWKLDQSLYAVGTGIPADSEMWEMHMELPSQNRDWLDDLNGGSELVVDEMSPVMLSAELRVDQLRSHPDTLRLRFSEAIDWDASGADSLFLFDFRAGGLLFQALEYSDFELGKSSIDIRYYSGMDADFPIQSGDYAKMAVSNPRITDKAGRKAWTYNPWIQIVGGDHQNVKVIPEVIAVDGQTGEGSEWPQSKNGSRGALSPVYYDNAEEAMRAAKERGNLKIVWGPIRYAQPLVGDPDPVLFWQVWIFDNLGQFVDEYHGVIDCGDVEVAGRCYTEEGMAARFAWNFKDRSGRTVGAGVYTMRISIGNEVRNFQIGVSRSRR
ncbi:MAG: VWA domain-containing protein, partial [Fibrobacterales bacterium]|nr:VWA domain-containing protein [Fibrobacterales bacterium]